VALFLLVCGALGLTACGGGSSSATTAGSGTTAEVSETSESGEGGSAAESKLRIGVQEEPLPNPAEATEKGYWASIYFSLAYAPLIHQAPAGKLEPALATSWEYVEGGGTPNSKFAMTIRKGAKFSDGEPVTAEAVVKWLDYFTETPGPFKEIFGKSPKFSASGEEVTIEMSTPNPRLPVILSDGGPNVGFVVAPKAIENPKLLSKETYGAGQYMLDPSQSLHEDHSVYVQNPNYYEPSAIKFKEVEVKLIAEPASRLEAQQSGQLDVALGDVTTVESAEGAGLNVLTVPQGVSFLVLDTKHGAAPALKDIRVREAINYAINRKAIAEALIPKIGTPASSFLLSDLDTGMENYWKYDPEKAKELLAEAGYSNGLTLPTITEGNYIGVFGDPLVRAVAKNLEEVGVKLEVTPYATDPAYAKDVFEFKAPVFNLLQILSDTPTVYSTYVAPGAVVNFFGTNPEIVKLYNEGARAKDPTPAWTKMWQVYTKEAYVVPLVVQPNIYYVSESIGGVEVSKEHNSALPTEWYPQ
jgi:peptide/nickel transport system substrate-binding protein